MTPVFAWVRLDMDRPLNFSRCRDGVYRPTEELAHRFEVRVIYGSGGLVSFRAVIGGSTETSELYYMSGPHADPRAALNEAADWHQARHAAVVEAEARAVG